MQLFLFFKKLFDFKKQLLKNTFLELNFDCYPLILDSKKI